ncbi:MAG: hypothetical protein L3J54_12065 [Draconibacterium sp.]|nr:hypothetical protein [Draconibacterium sp.]
MDDYKKNIEPFLNGELNVGDFKPDVKKDSDTDFIDVYKKVIDESKDEQLPDFNPFEKITSSNRKIRLNFFKRLLPYAAILLLLVGISSIFILSKFQQKTETNKYSEQQIAEIRKNTEYALLYFSRELNSTLKSFDITNVISNPSNDIKSYKIEFENPMKNLNITKL